MHGAYDFGLGVDIGGLVVMSMMLTLLLTMGLFLYFMQANAQDRIVAARTPLGYAVVPAVTTEHDNFCESCGKPNVRQQRYCEYCGHKL